MDGCVDLRYGELTCISVSLNPQTLQCYRNVVLLLLFFVVLLLLIIILFFYPRHLCSRGSLKIGNTKCKYVLLLLLLLLLSCIASSDSSLLLCMEQCGRSVYWSRSFVSPAEMVEPIEMPAREHTSLANNNNNNNNNNNRDDIYGAVIMAKPLWEFTRFIWWMQTKCRVAANPQTEPIDLDCESTGNGGYHPHPPSPFIII